MKSLLPGREQIPAIITLIIVLCLGAGYYFIYLPGNERDIQKWKFRTLKNIDTNIQKKITNGYDLLGTYLRHDSTISNYIIELKKQVPDIKIRNKQFLDSLGKINKVISKFSNNKFSTDTISGVRNKVSFEPPVYIDREKKLVVKRIDTIQDSTFEISISYPFKEFIIPLLPEDVFDGYIVLENNSVLFESPNIHSGLEYSNDSLLTQQSYIKGSVITDRTFGGIDYKLFIQPVICRGNVKLFVIGLLSAEHYQQGKTKLPPRAILFLITLFTVIIVSFPIIKLYQLGNEDRLTVTDGIMATLVSMLLISLLFFIFVQYNGTLHNGIFPERKIQPLEVLANNISKSFFNEIKKDLGKLRQLDSLMHRNPSYQKDLFDVDKDIRESDIHRDAIGKDTLKNLTPEDTIHSLTDSMDLDRIFWLDRDGDEKYAWRAGPQKVTKVTFHGNFKERKYFKNIINGQAWDSDSASIFYVEQVISWIDGAFITLISIPSVEKFKVAVLSFFVRSLDDVKLPLGYSFAMIDSDGKVLYHSKNTKNLQENLLEEFSQSNKLSICLKTASSQKFKTEYFGQQYQVFVKPLGGGLPYYLVILDSQSFFESRDIDVYSFTFSMQFLLFGLLIFQMLIVFFSSAKRSVYQDQLFDTTWLGPKKSFNHEYIVASRYNYYIFFLLCIFPFSSVLCRLFMLLLSVSILPVFLNLLYAKKYTTQSNFRNYKLKAAWAAGSIPILINIVALVRLHESFYRFLIFEVICIIPAIIILFGYGFAKEKFPESIKEFFSIIKEYQFKLEKRSSDLLISIYKIFPFVQLRNTFSRSFTSLIFSWILVTCGLPVIIFFTSSYNYDQHLIARTKQFSLVNKLVNDINYRESQKENPRVKKELKMDSISHSFYHDSLWVLNSGIEKYSEEMDPEDDEIAINILDKFRIYENQNKSGVKDLSKTRAFDLSFYFNNLMRQVSSESDTTKTYVRLNNQIDYLWVSSAPLNFSLPSLFNWGGILCWISLLILLGAMYKLFHSIINKLFALNIPDTSAWHNLDKKILASNDVNNLLFITGVPHSGKKEIIEKIFQNKRKFIFDFRLLPGTEKKSDELSAEWNKMIIEESKSNYNLIIIDHFEYNFKDINANNIKLRILESLVIKSSKNHNKIIILSDIHSGTFLEVLNEIKTRETDPKNAEPKNIERWYDLLGNFRILIHRLSQFDRKGNPMHDCVIWEETENAQFLNDLYKPILNVSGRVEKKIINEEKEESLVFKLQSTSYHFYFSIWQSLNPKEKFLLYDLAEDGLVNPFDKNTLCLLLDKGIILHKDGRLRLFSKGFRHFVLTDIGTRETAEIMEKVNDNRNWNKIKIPLALISLTIIAFLLSSQRETSTNLITTLTALAGIIPVLINFLSSLGSGNTQKAK